VTGRYTSEQLKKIAMGTMFIDHAAVALIYNAGLNEGSTCFETIGLAMRLIGRMAFPLYAFLLVQGFLWTRDWARYGARVAVFALISEIPYDLVAFGSLWSMEGQNTMFTMLLGLVCMRGIRWAEESDWCEGEADAFPRHAMVLLIAAAGALVAWFLRADYGAFGVLLILVFYMFRFRPAEQWFGGCAVLYLMYFGIYAIAAWIAIFLISRYNGERGKKMGYWPYVFYPVHLLMLAVMHAVFAGI